MSNIVSVPADFRKIQDAINSIGPGGSIVVRLTEARHEEDRVQVNDGREVTVESVAPERTTWTGNDRRVWGLIEIRSYGNVHLRRIVMDTERKNRAIWADDGNLTMEDCDVVNCRRESAAFTGGFGGAIECRHTIVRMTRCRFIKNIIEDNAAAVGCYGGALYFNRNCKVLIEACNIESNEVFGSGIAGQWGLGGGIWCEDSHMTVRDTIIRRNEVRADLARGGGVALKNVLGVEFTNSEITWNKASGKNSTRHGREAGIFLERGLEEPVKFTNCVIEHNHTEDGDDPFVIRR